MPAKKQKLCFVLMPFKDEMKEVYWKAIKPACEEAGFDSLRVDELKGTFNINRKIIEHIFTSDAVVADLTGWNPNVFYELGVVHAISNKTIMIIQKKDRLPFDVSTYHTISYEQTDSGMDRLKTKIKESLLCIDDWCNEPTNPVQEFKSFEALIPRSDLDKGEALLKQKEKLLANAIPHTEYKALKKELTQAQTELDKRPTTIEVSALKKEVEKLRSQLEQKKKQIRVILDEADKKKADEHPIIKPPEGMVFIPAGEFIMGTSDEQFKRIEKLLKEHKDWKREWFECERPAHKVYLDDFFIDKYLVTNTQFAEFLNEWGKDTDEDGQEMIYEHKWGVHPAKSGIKNRWEPHKGFEDHPVIYVTWYGAKQYAKWAEKKLLTEAQWEKAARGGKDFEYATKDGTINHNLANYDGKIGKTTPVGKYPPNPYSIYDMSGNVWEWCNDWFDEKYYDHAERDYRNPTGPAEGDYCVFRGGSWGSEAVNLRSSGRYWYDPKGRFDDVGFRCSRAYR